MKRYCLLLATLLFAITVMAQDFNQTDSKGRRQGPWRDFYPSGQLRYEGQFKNDKCKGTFRYYLSCTVCERRDTNELAGKAPNGRVIATGYYLNQKKDGEWKYYDANSGQLRLVEDNKEGKVHGSSKLYNPNNGVLAEEMQYVEGQPEGPCKKYSDMGVLIMECQYHNGVLDGPTKSYYPSTALKEEGQYAKGQKSGTWKTYNEDGDVILEETFGEFVY